MQGGAKLVDHGADGLIRMLDADGSGKFSMDDLRIRARQSRRADGQARDAVQNGATWAMDQGHRALDRDGDGRLGLGDVAAGAGQLRNAAVSGIKRRPRHGDQCAQPVQRRRSRWRRPPAGPICAGILAMPVRRCRTEDAACSMAAAPWSTPWSTGGSAARDWFSDQAGRAGQAIHHVLDADGDGRLGMGDVATMGRSALNGLNNARHAVQDRVGQAGPGAAHAADRDGDGHLGWNDVRAGAGQVRNAVVGGAQRVAIPCTAPLTAMATDGSAGTMCAPALARSAMPSSTAPRTSSTSGQSDLASRQHHRQRARAAASTVVAQPGKSPASSAGSSPFLLSPTPPSALPVPRKRGTRLAPTSGADCGHARNDSRVRMSKPHYGGNLVDGAQLLSLFGDVATELCILADGDEGLFRAYDSVEFWPRSIPATSSRPAARSSAGVAPR